MKSCDNGHCYIEFDDHSCPVCDLQIEYAKLQREVRISKVPRKRRTKDDKERIKDLQKKNGVLREKLKEIKSIVSGRL